MGPCDRGCCDRVRRAPCRACLVSGRYTPQHVRRAVGYSASVTVSSVGRQREADRASSWSRRLPNTPPTSTCTTRSFGPGRINSGSELQTERSPVRRRSARVESAGPKPGTSSIRCRRIDRVGRCVARTPSGHQVHMARGHRHAKKPWIVVRQSHHVDLPLVVAYQDRDVELRRERTISGHLVLGWLPISHQWVRRT